MSLKPYLSIVATTRNDNHGGDLIKRTICFVEGIYHQARKYNLSTELIMVEWNPPKDKPLLKDVLPKPPKGTPVTLRYVIVPSEIHDTFRFAKAIPLYQMIGKNVGIRRAQGEFVLCTNIDLLFSDACFKRLAEKNLEYNSFYRANRCDIPKEVMQLDTVEKQLHFGKNNIIKRLGKVYNYRHTNGFPNFFFMFPNALLILDKTLGLMKKIFGIKIRNSYNIYSLDCEACGDFTLMSKKDWLRIDGYCELDMYSLHIDSMALISCLAIGMKQNIFPLKACSYHIYHEDGWESNYKKPEDLIRFLVNRPALDWYTVSMAGKKLIESGKPYKLNNENWGYSDIDLEEYIFEGN